MGELSTYSLEDFLLFAPRTYWRVLTLHNGALWPLHLATLAAGLGLLALILARPARAPLWVGLGLGAAWACVGWLFLQNRYAPINWAVEPMVPVFLLQAVLLALAGVLPRGLAFARLDGIGWAGLGLAGLGLLYPGLTLVLGRPLAQVEVFGIAPDPTALVTLGLLLCARSPRPGLLLGVLMPVPLLWGLFSGLTLLAMDEVQAWALFAALALSLALLATRLARRTGAV